MNLERLPPATVAPDKRRPVTPVATLFSRKAANSESLRLCPSRECVSIRTLCLVEGTESQLTERTRK